MLVTELIAGLNLSEIIKRHGALEVSDACAIVIEVCRALSYIDSQGLVHRDIKPSNIMIDDHGTVKLLDLGLARVQASEGDIADFTATGQAIGTADYVAPEQINDGRNVDIRADIYGLGCTLYKLLSGRAPFATPQHATAFAKMNAHVSDTPEPLTELRTGLPAKLQQCVQTMLAKSPADRPQTVDRIIQQLQPLAESADLQALVKKSKSLSPQEPVQLLPTSTHNQLSQPKTKSFLFRRVPAIAAIGAALAGILFGMWLGVLITIKKPDGSSVTLQAPDASTVVIDDQGNAVVQLAGGSADSTADPNASPASQTMKEVTLPVDQAFVDEYQPGDLVNVAAAYEKSHPFIAILKPVQSVSSSNASLNLTETEFADYEAARSAGVKIYLDTHSVDNLIQLEHRNMNGVWTGKVESNITDESTRAMLDEWAILIFNDQITAFSASGRENTVMIERSRLRRTLTAIPPFGNQQPIKLSYRFMDDQQNVVNSFDFKDDQHLLEFSSADPTRPFRIKLQKLKTPSSPSQQYAFAAMESIKQAPIRFEVFVAKPESYFDAKDFGAKKIDLKGADQQYWIRPKPFFTNRDVVLARIFDDIKGEEPQLCLSFDYALADRVGKSLPVGKGLKLIYMVDGKVVFAPTIDQDLEIARLYIKGGFSKTELRNLRDKILPNENKMKEDRKQSANQLRQLTLACLTYEAENQHFPASKILHKESGKFHSWRVAILPYLNQQHLYDKYHFDEQWDSPHNSKLLKKMPPPFRHSSADYNSTTTNYVGFANDKAAFGIEKGHRIQDFKDGTSNTLLLIEADSQIPWTKPEDLPFNDKTLENLKRLDQGRYIFSKADGSVDSIKNADMPLAKLKALLTRGGGEKVDGEGADGR